MFLDKRKFNGNDVQFDHALLTLRAVYWQTVPDGVSRKRYQAVRIMENFSTLSHASTLGILHQLPVSYRAS